MRSRLSSNLCDVGYVAAVDRLALVQYVDVTNEDG